jgi:archaellum biogenesis ATPase FlaH
MDSLTIMSQTFHPINKISSNNKIIFINKNRNFKNMTPISIKHKINMLMDLFFRFLMGSLIQRIKISKFLTYVKIFIICI